MYKAIIFDLGNVLVQISYQRILDYWAEKSKRRLAGALRSFIDDQEKKYEKSEISAAVFRKNIKNRIGFQLTDQEFDEGWNRIFIGKMPGIESVLQQLRPNYRLVGLSNTNQIHTDFWRKEYADLLLYFEKFFCSQEIKASKPDVSAYRLVINYLQLPPEQVIFIDDKPENVDGAIKLGITGVLMTSVEQLRHDLNQLGVSIVADYHYEEAVRNAKTG